MSKVVLSGLLGLVSTLFLATTASAEPLEDALASYQAGDFSAAIKMLTPLAETGNPVAQDTLYRIYWYGKGTSPDYDRALKWARTAAALGSSDAENGLAIAYSFGLSVPRDPTEGARLFQKAADDGSAEAQTELARRYLNGEGVEKDTAKGLQYLHMAADKGLARAMVALGKFAADGSFGVQKDSADSRHWFTLAAEQRFSPAQVYFAASAGDPIEAAMWEILASTTGCSRGRPLVQSDFFTKSLSKDDFAKAQEMAAAWDKSHPPVDINQYDEALNICFLNYGTPSAAAQASTTAPTEVKQDTTGKGAVLCIWTLYVDTEATVSACGLSRRPVDDAIDEAIPRIDKFIIANSSHPVTQKQLDAANEQQAGLTARSMLQVDQIRNSCDGRDVEPFRQWTPDAVRKMVDELLSVPREPLMNPCL